MYVPARSLSFGLCKNFMFVVNYRGYVLRDTKHDIFIEFTHQSANIIYGEVLLIFRACVLQRDEFQMSDPLDEN